LCGIKFFLDESGDIIFLNDLFSLQVVPIDQTSPTIWSSSKSMIEDDKSKLSTGNESADILFCCETFEVIVLEQQHGTAAALLFRSFTGHHIEFRTNTIKPLESMILKCEGLCCFLRNFSLPFFLRHHFMKVKKNENFSSLFLITQAGAR
jgi:hypothetical protein